MKTSLRTHSCGELSKENAGQKVKLSGWVDSARISGKIGFLDIRDRYGKVQVILEKDLAQENKSLTKEDIIQITGEVKARPANQVKGTGTAEIEILAESLKILKKVSELPMDIHSDVKSTEETRMKYRYLDLRKPEMQEIFVLRHNLTMAVREFFDKEKFVEIETPILAKSTPEGARDYLVPSRTFKGNFFALPQSPQTFKQILMIAGFDRYFQLARCFRDEDLRADRQPEFTQLDLEMSFIDEEDIYSLFEKMMVFVFKKVLNKDIKIPFPRITYADAMSKYKTDKPDLRKETKQEFSFAWITHFPMFEYSETEKRYQAMHHPFTSPNLEDLDKLKTDKAKVRSRAYDLVLNGFELGGGSIRIHDTEVQNKVFDALGISKEDAKKKFGFLLEALQYAPPHGGIALGLDRWVMLMANRDNIRDVIAFPKNQQAKDLMLDSPSEVDEDQLHELGLFLYEE